MKLYCFRALLVPALFVCASTALIAETAEATFEAASLWGKTERATMEMRLDIETGRGSKSRSLKSKLFAQVTAPAFLNKMKYLYIRSANGDESKWVSTSRGTRQLSNAQRTEKLFDSDFTAEDLSKLAVEDYAFSPAPAVGGLTSVRATPKRSGESARIISIDPATGLIMRVQYLDSRGEVERIYQVEETRMIESILAVSVCTMTDVQAGTTSRLTILSFDPDSDIPPRVFSRASL